MSRNNTNRKRAFADVVVVDAWHDSFNLQTQQASLHAEVSFGTARVGGDIESQIRFRLSVRRAELVIVLPTSEPLLVKKKSVSRDSDDVEFTLTRKNEKTKKANFGGRIASFFSPRNLRAEAGLSVAVESSGSDSAITTRTTSRLMKVIQSETDEGFYRWVIESRANEPLNGRPWDGKKKPRLILSDTRQDRNRGIEPSVRVEVRCLREDLVIEDIELKDEKLMDKLRSKAGFENRMAAAESYIRDRLLETGLEVNNIHDKFGRLTLVSVVAEPN